MASDGEAARDVSTRDRILAHASMLFADRGYYQTSTRDIADAAGIEQLRLFHHFASKTEIMNTLLKLDLEAAVAAAEYQRAQSGSPALRLYRYLIEDVVIACRSPYNPAGLTPKVRMELDFAGARARHGRLLEARVGLILEGIEAGEFVPIDAHSASRAIEWTIEGLLLDLGGDGFTDPEDTAREVAGFCLRALLVDPARLEGIRTASNPEDPGT